MKGITYDWLQISNWEEAPGREYLGLHTHFVGRISHDFIHIVAI